MTCTHRESKVEGKKEGERDREREIYTYQIFYLCYDIVTEIQLFQILS